MKKSKVAILLFIMVLALSYSKVFANTVLINPQQDMTQSIYTGGHNFGFWQPLGNGLTETFRYIQIRTTSTSTINESNSIRLTSCAIEVPLCFDTSEYYATIGTSTDEFGYLRFDMGANFTFDPDLFYSLNIEFNSGAPLGYVYGGSNQYNYKTLYNPWGEDTLGDFNSIYFELSDNGIFTGIDTSLNTRIISVTSPLNESVQASTTVTFSGTYYIASSTITTTSNVFMYLYIQNRSNDTSTTSLNDYKILSFPVTALDTNLSFSTTTVLLNNSRFSWTASLRRGDMQYGPVPFSDENEFYQFTTGVFDSTFGQNFDLSSCNPLSNFSITTCIYNLIYPNNVIFPIVLEEAKREFGTRVPWGYVTRLLKILTATTTAVSMPTIDYSFASSSPMSAVGNIHFEPFTLIAQSGTLINEMKSDRADSKTVWQIFMPFINMFIYVVLLFMIIHDLTGIHTHKLNNDKQNE